MLKFKLVSLFLILLTLNSFAQVSVKGTAENTYNITNDAATIDNRIRLIVPTTFLSDSLVAADTTALKLRKGAADGQMVYLDQSGYSGWYAYGDSTYPEGAFAFDAAENGKQWTQKDTKEIWINPSNSTNSIKTVFSLVQNYPNVVLRFEYGTYDLSAQNWTIKNCRNLYLDLNGSTLIFNDKSLTISTSTDSARIDSIGPSLFTTNVLKDSNWVGITDTSAWTNLDKGDLISLADGNSYPGGTTVSNGFLGIFDHFETGRIVFKNYAIDSVAIMDIPATSDSIKYVNHYRTANRSIIVNGGHIVNGKLTLNGFDFIAVNNLSASASNASSFSVATAALQIFYCRYVVVNNYSALGYLVTGYGYGIIAGTCDQVIVNNANFTDCRHGFTTSGTIYTPGVRYVRLANVSAIASEAAITWGTGAAFDTHPGTQNFIVDGFYSENYSPVINLRSEKCILKNGTVRGTEHVISVAANQNVENLKKNITVSNCELYNIYDVVAISSSERIGRIELNNVKAWAKELSGASTTTYPRGLLLSAITSVDNTFIDSLIVDRCEFYGIPGLGTGGKNLIRYDNADAADAAKSLKYVSISKTAIKDIAWLFWFDDLGISELIFHKNEVRDCYQFMRLSTAWADSATSRMARFDVTGNYFSGITGMVAWGKQRIENMNISGNTWDDTGLILPYANNAYVAGNILFTNNVIRNPKAQAIFTWSASYGSGKILYANNTIEQNNGQRYFAYLRGSGMGRPNLQYVGNTIVGSYLQYQGFDVQAADVDIIGNTFIVDSTTANTGFMVYQDSSNVKFINNYVYLYGIGGTPKAISVRDNDDTLNISGNLFFGEGTITGMKAVSVISNATVFSGINQTNFATPLDTTGSSVNWTSSTKFGD